MSKAIFALLLCSSLGTAGAATSTAKPDNSQWRLRMRAMAALLTELLPDVTIDERFNSAAGKKRVDANTKKLAELAKGVAEHTKTAAPDTDPTLPIIGTLFETEATRVAKEMDRGHRVYARTLLRTITTTCFSCHSRTAPNANFPANIANPGNGPWDKLQKTIQTLPPMDRANFLAATRQFDQALDEYEKLLSGQGLATQNLFAWENAARNGLAIAVRVKKDPDRAISLVDRILAAKSAPFFLRENAAAWKEALNKWKAEGNRKITTNEGYFAEAVRLVREAKEAQNFPADHSADVQYLRATAALHESLKTKTLETELHDANAFLLLGVAYENLQGLNLGELSEIYYQACIYRSPGTETARSCFKNYQYGVMAGYTGTAGTDVPEDIRQRLQKLEGLATGADKPKGADVTP